MVYEESQSNAMTQNLQSQKDVNSAQAMQLLSNVDWGKTTMNTIRFSIGGNNLFVLKRLLPPMENLIVFVLM